VLAFAANLFCLMVLWRRRDIVIGLLVASVFGRWAVQVIRDASRAVAVSG